MDIMTVKELSKNLEFDVKKLVDDFNVRTGCKAIVDVEYHSVGTMDDPHKSIVAVSVQVVL
jgi:hypothetical protein